MKFSMKWVVLSLILAIGAIHSPMDAIAKGGGGGGRSSGGFGGGGRSFSSSRSSSSSKPSSSPSRLWGGSSKPSAPSKPATAPAKSAPAPAKPASSFWGGNKNKAATAAPAKTQTGPVLKAKTESTADTKLREASAMKAGTAFKDQSSAMNDFKAKNGSRYQNNFKTEPAVRPNYIPGRTNVNGQDRDVIFVQGRGYGYYDSLGTFMMYDAMSDMMMMNMLMSHSNYHYPNMPVYQAVQTTGTVMMVAPAKKGMSTFGKIMLTMLGVGIVIVVIFACKRNW